MSKTIITSFRRYEKKYFLTKEQYGLFRQSTAPFVSADEYGKYSICNIYYDTDDYRLIRASLEKPVYKEKLRVRSYGVPGPDDRVFAEIKKKYDGVVYKRRITMTDAAAESFLRGIRCSESRNQIAAELEYFQQFYKTKPKAFIAYDREAFKGNENPELRITFDTNLRYRLDRLSLREGDDGRALIDGDLILMEIKIPESCPLWLCNQLSELKIQPVSFSKYGTCYKKLILGNNHQSLKKEMRLSA